MRWRGVCPSGPSGFSPLSASFHSRAVSCPCRATLAPSSFPLLQELAVQMQLPLCPTSTGLLDLTGLLPELTHDSQAPVWIRLLCSSLPVCCHSGGSILSPRFPGVEAHVLLCVSLALFRRLHNVCCCYACSPFCSLNNWAEKQFFIMGKL